MSYFVSNKWLLQRMQQEEEQQGRLVIVDARYDLMDADAGELAYREGHIPGAHYASLSHHLSSGKRPDGVGGRHPLPSPESVAAFFASIGIRPGATVVAYDDQGGAMASRLRWLLQWIGFEGEAYVLEGGYKGWVEAQLPISVNIPQRLEDAILPVKLQHNMVVAQEQVKQAIAEGGTIIIDSRDGARYRGELEPIDRAAGHIPTAINHFWQEGKNADGTWKSAEQQAERFAGIDKNASIIVYCGSGVTATPNVFALQEAGYRNVRLYAGSWSEWSANPDNPVATGEE
ncbi:thiosulfate sulfurtransferase [Paenibacillus montaniterrae]|uniref:Sulfurtransferase n=1 Tax=Paenibacillus montaniterrae TaxID=429341 RepID=A0A920CYD9_9BACL|nr:sulfurtransferase [Paenibacillus montaniterrae]GIP16283.1 thiosulfate sulfurtransferase [Paenibacillus montaniterrae]